MKVILTTNIKKLGKIGDQVSVKDGFARNYLFPKKMALRNTIDNLKYYEKIKEDIEIKENEKKQQSVDLINQIKKIKIEFTKEADEKDQLYGSISKKEIINYLKENEINIHSDDIQMIKPIRNIGNHEINISPYLDLSETVIIKVNKN